MGCYNGEGCISGLPIECGDPIGGIICVSTKDYDDNEMITPVWPIIWGEYDDYGGIEMSSIDCELEPSIPTFSVKVVATLTAS